MKKLLLLTSFATFYSVAIAQQDIQLTNWMFDKLSFNPAAAGIDQMQCLTMFYRDQWDGFDRDPKTMLLNYNGYHPKTLMGGLGLTFLSDRLGQETNTAFKLSYAPHFSIGSNTKVSVGLGLGYLGKKLGKDWIYNDEGDPIIPTTAQSAGTFDLNFGAMIFSPKKYYAGISANHLTASELTDLNIKVARHYYFMGGYDYPINSDITLRSNVLYKTDFNAGIFDINVNALWNDMVWAGVSYRHKDAVAPMVGFKYEMTQSSPTSDQTWVFLLGYSYDATLSDIKTYSAGSHEIFFSICFNITPKLFRQIHGNPRTL